ncbi:MAG: MMPL family transporter [Verrucomicrobiota bacterium]
MSQSQETWAIRVLTRLSDAVFRRPNWFIYPQLALFVVCVVYTVKRLEFQTDRDSLVGANKTYHQNFLNFKKEFPAEDDLVVVIESESPDKNRQFVERLGSKLERETNLFTDVFYKGDLKMMGNKALLFVPDDDLQGLKTMLGNYRPFLQQFTRATNFTSLFSMVNTQFRTAKREANAENESMVKALPALERIISQATDALERPGRPVSPGINAMFGGQEAEQQMYITFAEGRFYLVTARPRSQGVSEDAVYRLRELVRQVQYEVPGLNVGMTGEKVLEVDEMAQSQTDTTVATIVSLIICVLIFIFGYNQTGRPLKATACLVVGIGYTMAFTTTTVGHLNILTITFVPILIGLAIDFGVHLISRYEEELRKGRPEQIALRLAMTYTGQGIFTGCFTTAFAFLAMGLTDFRGIQEMGVICGGGLLVSLIPMMTMLPALLLRGRQNVMDHQAHEDERRARIEQIWLSRPWTVLGLTVAISAFAVLQFKKVGFDYNLLHMQSDGLPAVEYEKKLISSAGKSVLFCASVVSDLDQAARWEEQYKKLPTVGSVESLTPFLRGDQTHKLELIGEIKQVVSTIHFAPADTEPVNVAELSGVLWSLRGYLGLTVDDIKTTEPKLAQQCSSLRDAIQEFRKAMLKDERVSAEKLAAYQHAFFVDVRDMFAALQHQDNREKLQVADLPPALRNRFVGRSGKFLLQVYPKDDVWEREPQKRFVTELRTVDPTVTGTPVQLLEYTTLLKDSYIEAAKYSLVAIILLAFIHFRNLASVVLVLLPVLIGAVWMGGTMGLRGIMFNPANIMTLPLVIGIGVTNGIHVLNRFAEERQPSIFARSTGKAVLVSGLTTIAGFGSLVLGKHQGISSLGFVMSIGVATCMIAGVTFLPALLNLMCRHGWTLGMTGKAAETVESESVSGQPKKT